MKNKASMQKEKNSLKGCVRQPFTFPLSPFPFLLVLAFAFQLTSFTVSAQHHAPKPMRYTLSFEARHGESYTVFIDGDMMNRMPQSRVIVSDVSDQTHEVVVVLKRPAQKAAVLQLRPSEPNVIINVDYDARLEQLSLYTPSHNLAAGRAAEYHYQGARLPEVKPVPPVVVVQQPVPEVQHVTEMDLAAMLKRMKDQTFDSDRLALGKVIVASSNLTASQISRLAATLDFSSSQVELLKYAYPYCIDPQNYYKAVDVLTFSTDKKKVMDYIATLK